MQTFEFQVDLTSRARATPKRRVSTRSILPPIVNTLVLAHQIDRAVSEGRARSLGDAARQLGISQPRVTQIMKLSRLAPMIQEQILLGDRSKFQHLSEHQLRVVTGTTDSQDQLALFTALMTK